MNRNQKYFDNEFDAKVQCLALANFWPMGRHKVYKRGDRYVVEFDECKVRDGVEDDYIFQAVSHCNSGTMTYKEARDRAEKELLGIC